MADLPPIADPERALSLAYAPRATRHALGLLWRLDEQLGSIVARADSPAVAQMRLTWWHEALRTARTSRPVDPLLVALAETDSLDLEALLPLIDGWEVLLDPLPLDLDALDQYAEGRGGTLFAAAARLLESEPDARDAGRMWALVDLAHRISDPVTATLALERAPTSHARLPRALAMLSALARLDQSGGRIGRRRQGSPGRLLRALVAGMTGH